MPLRQLKKDVSQTVAKAIGEKIIEQLSDLKLGEEVLLVNVSFPELDKTRGLQMNLAANIVNFLRWKNIQA